MPCTMHAEAFLQHMHILSALQAIRSGFHNMKLMMIHMMVHTMLINIVNTSLCLGSTRPHAESSESKAKLTYTSGIDAITIGIFVFFFAVDLHIICMFLQQVDWGKGRALAHMLTALGLDDCDDVIPIYLGDDRTDEDAFKVLKERATGFGILISNKVSCLISCLNYCQEDLLACF